jgi:signal transduction histidine kinase
MLETVAGLLALTIQNTHLSSRIRPQAMGDIDQSEKATKDLEAVVRQLRSEVNYRAKVEAAAQQRSEKLTELNAALVSQNEELNAFSHTVAHDLKNPLSILLGFAELLEQDYGDGDDQLLKQGVEVILENGRRMANIIDELLLLAEVRKLDEIDKQPLDMARIVDEIQKRLQPLIEESQATLIVPPAWPTALGHHPWVQEIWVNYVSNAIKYGGRPPKVELGSMVQRDSMIRFWVRDNGNGISIEDQKRLFSPFTKLDRKRAQGHGLGLSIVQRIVTKLGGEAGVQSKLRRGSLFWFTLPMDQEEEG